MEFILDRGIARLRSPIRRKRGEGKSGRGVGREVGLGDQNEIFYNLFYFHSNVLAYFF